MYEKKVMVVDRKPNIWLKSISGLVDIRTGIVSAYQTRDMEMKLLLTDFILDIEEEVEDEELITNNKTFLDRLPIEGFIDTVMEARHDGRLKTIMR